jgi:redox-sensitive bicupin YhaK (pirin superfamily)
MMQLRRGPDRGHANHGWLDTYHTFSFADYYDEGQLGFRALRVLNEDRVQPGRGFGTHGHQDMEILTYVLAGQLQHRDSLGTGSVLRPGELQRMSAGTGVRHSEFNPSAAEPVHFYQIWLLPERRGLAPSYEQKAFVAEGRRGRWQRVASPDGRDGSLTIHQDAHVFLADVAAGQPLDFAPAPGRHTWLQVLRGAADVNGQALAAGDGLAVSGEPALRVAGAAEVMLFDLA